MPMITNISAYLFATLDGLEALRVRLLAVCRRGGLKGTILLSREGINLFVAGARGEIEGLVAELRAVEGLAGLMPKYSESGEQPFARMLVKIKKEIIAFGVEGIDPARRPSAKVDAATLKQWLDEGRAVTLLDTRNEYEVKLGTFRGARGLGIGTFRELPEAVGRLPEELKEQPVVMFCTGGIRCEKAGPFMEQAGFRQIFQLDGGILKYFEVCGGAHFEGECFVFDQRVGVDPALQETEAVRCAACQMPLTVEDRRDARFQPPLTCPFCHEAVRQREEENLVARNAALRRLTVPLPASEPHENRRPLKIPAWCEGLALAEALGRIFPEMPREEWVGLCEGGSFLHELGWVVGAGAVVREGERYVRVMRAEAEPEVNGDIRIVHEDEAVIVVRKPAGLPMHPGGGYERHTLRWFLSELYAPESPRPMHELEAEVGGVVVYARTRHFAGLLGVQFARGEVEMEAGRVAFTHPLTQQRVSFSAEPSAQR